MKEEKERADMSKKDRNKKEEGLRHQRSCIQNKINPSSSLIESFRVIDLEIKKYCQ